MRKQPKQEGEKREFYVQIEQPREVRRQVLESSRGIIQGLREYEKLKTIREERAARVEEFYETIKEIHDLVAKMRQKLPHYAVRDKKEIATLREDVVSKSQHKADAKSEELQRLDKDLAEIEARLNNI